MAGNTYNFIIYFSLLAVLTTACVHHPRFYRVYLKSRMKNKFHYNIHRSNLYCPETDEKGRHSKGKDGYKYQHVCTDSNGNRLYLSKRKAISDLSQIVTEECKKQNLRYKFIGQENIKEFVKMSESRCQTTVTENQDTSSYGTSYNNNRSDTSDYHQNSNTSGSGYSTTTCSPSYPIYRYSTDLHYLCEPK